jgi:hypothetical protein
MIVTKHLNLFAFNLPAVSIRYRIALEHKNANNINGLADELSEPICRHGAGSRLK